MSKKNFDEYYFKVVSQYQEMVNDLKEVEELCKTSMLDPVIYENMVKTLEPVKNSYSILSYVKYLLDMPVKKKKVPKYERVDHSFAKVNGKTLEKENKESLQKAQSILHKD